MAPRLAALSLLALTSLRAAPELSQSDDRWTLRNDHLALQFDVAKGGLLSRVEDRDGRAYLVAGTVYTDHGVYAERQRVASDRATGTLATDGPGTVIAAGTLTADGPLPAGPRIAYTQRVTLADEPEFAFRTELRSDRAIEDTTGFLALLWHLPPVTEWWARTVDGQVNELAGGYTRSYQSASEPLDPARPELGVAFGDGRRLLLTEVRAEAGPLANVFLHHAEQYTALFLAWLDGGRSADWSPETAWVVSGRLRVVPPTR